MSLPQHHKELVSHIKTMVPGHISAANYRDDHGKRPVMICEFGPKISRFYTTIGVCDASLSLPPGRFELATIGKLPWLPNALVSSVYWLKKRKVDEWPLVCEDVVRPNSRSTYRHMAYIPASYCHEVTSGPPVSWLLGVPVTDLEIGLSFSEAVARVAAVFPAWLIKSEA